MLQLLDLWDEEQDGDADECYLGEEPGCCMIGPEPLLDLCERLDKGYVAPVVSKLFQEALADEDEQPCVTVEKMVKLIREKALNVHPLQSVDAPMTAMEVDADLVETRFLWGDCECGHARSFALSCKLTA